jgi:hypothetical protein
MYLFTKCVSLSGIHQNDMQDRNTHIKMLDKLKGTVRPDWICVRVVPLEWIGIKKDITRYRFFIFLFLILNI